MGSDVHRLYARRKELSEPYAKETESASLQGESVNRYSGRCPIWMLDDGETLYIAAKAEAGGWLLRLFEVGQRRGVDIAAHPVKLRGWVRLYYTAVRLLRTK